MDPRNLIGSIKAAILVQALGWDIISPVMDQLSKGERNLIFKLQSKLGSISPALVESVAREFLEKATPPKQLESSETDEGGDATGDGLDDPLHRPCWTALHLCPDDRFRPGADSASFS